MSQELPDPYVIEGSLPDRYPRGWFCIGAHYEFTSAPKKLDYFGTSLVAYRGTESGEIHVLDAYCPHMGANLAGGHVAGDSIVCPFHAWSWGSDGMCDHIPYAKNIPAKARIKSWPVMEENELVYLWHDPDGGPPIEEQRIPHEPALDKHAWTPWVIHRVVVNSNCRELIDNMADKAHFGPVHGSSKITGFTNISEGHTYTQLMQGEGPSGPMDSRATYYGPGYMLHYMDIHSPEGSFPFMSLVMNVPTAMEQFEFLAGFKYPVPPGMEDNPLAQVEFVKQQIDENIQGVFADLAIWQDKVTIDNPLLCDGDGPVNRLRQWYHQFLVPVDEVPSSLTEKKVYEKNEEISF